MGNHYFRSGKAKYLGGVGRKVRGISRRAFKPNLQTIQCQVGGSVQRCGSASSASAAARCSGRRAHALPDADQPVSAESHDYADEVPCRRPTWPGWN